jgi:hypothetical protein
MAVEIEEEGNGHEEGSHATEESSRPVDANGIKLRGTPVSVAVLCSRDSALPCKERTGENLHQQWNGGYCLRLRQMRRWIIVRHMVTVQHGRTHKTR